MNRSTADISSIRVAKPCHATWDSMHGDDRVRRCGECELNVYNTAEMTKSEIIDLIAKREGRLCIRVFRRADETLLTRECPIGLRAYQKRVARYAAAAFAAVAGLFTPIFGQKNELPATETKQTRSVNAKKVGEFVLTGTVTDPNAAVVPGLEIKLFVEGAKKPIIKSISDHDGRFKFLFLVAGVYRLEITSKEKLFKTTIYEDIEVGKEKEKNLDVVVEPGSISVTVGIFAEEPMIDPTSSSVTTTIDRRKIESIPH